MNTDNTDSTKQDATISSTDNTETKIATDELSEVQLAKASGGSITKTIDKSSPVFFQSCVATTKSP